uniref:Uncharacterized protein n=1 Tax=Rhizophora mucronata TaxID=61149 RepID=A0A2P2MYY7_RHIMU
MRLHLFNSWILVFLELASRNFCAAKDMQHCRLFCSVLHLSCNITFCLEVASPCTAF